MNWLVKLSGKVLDDTTKIKRFVLQVKKIANNHKVVVVHGGGLQVSKWMQDLGLVPRFVDGLRVTDEKTLDVVTSVLCGLVNKQLVLQFLTAGIKKVVGISCVDGKFLVTKLIPSLGYVGRDVVRVNSDIIELLLKNGYLVLIATVGLAVKNGSLVLVNINADDVVYALTKKFKFERVIFITDTPGVFDKDGNVIKQLSIRKINELIQQGVVTEGMIPKLAAVRKMFLSGVKKIVITDNLLGEGTVLV